MLVIDHGRSSPTTLLPRRHWLATESHSVEGSDLAAASAVVAARSDLSTSNGSREVTIAGRFEQGTRALPWLLREPIMRESTSARPMYGCRRWMTFSPTGRSLREGEVAA